MPGALLLARGCCPLSTSTPFAASNRWRSKFGFAGPVFRDALVFHDAAGNIGSVLNICFQCAYLQNEQGGYVDADAAVFARLQTLLRRLGHPVADDHAS